MNTKIHHSLSTFILVLFTTVQAFSQSTCSITASSSAASINCGESVQLTSFGLGGSNVLVNDFNNGTAGSGWTTTSGAQYDNPCGAGPGGAHMWMGAGSAAPRTIATVGLNIACTGTVCFDFKMATQGGASPCEGPDATGEGIYLQYSIDGGTTWTTINYFDPAPGGGTDPILTSWNNYCYPIPAGAVSANTMFRWAQTTVSSSTNDHWGIDNVNITLNCGTPYHYNWIPATGLSASNIANPVATPLTSTTYTVYYTNGVNDSCMAIVPIAVNLPTVDAGAVQTVCAGSPVSLNATSSFGSGPQTLTFTNSNPVAIVDNQTITSTVSVTGFNQTNITANTVITVCLDISHTWDADLDISLSCPGGTTIDLSSDNGGSANNYTSTCFSATAATAVTAGTAPFTGSYTPEQAFSNLISCLANGTWTLSVHDDTGGDQGTLNSWSITLTDNAATVASVAWSPNTNMTNATTLTPTLTPTVTTTYTVTVTGSNNCSKTDTVTVFVNALPVADAGIDTATCAGTPVNLLASGGTTYSWSPAATLSSSTVANPVATPSVTTNYIVTVSNGTCSDKDTVQVVIKALPNVDAGANTQICTGASVNLNATGAATYSWSPGTYLSANNIANPVSTPGATITYTVTGTAANGCVQTDSVQLTIISAPSANAGTDTAFCDGTSVNLNASGGGTYSWSPASGLSNSTIANPVANPAATTTYTLTVSAAGGCFDTDTMVVTVKTMPNTDAGTNQVICPGGAVQLSASGAVSYTWTPAASLNNPAIFDPIATPSATTTYTVVGTAANGCSKSDLVSVAIGPGISITMSSNVSVCAGASTNLSATSSANTYSWSPATGLNVTNAANVVATPAVTTTYTVTATNTSTGCTGTDSVTVTVNNAPNANAGNDVSVCNGSSTNLSASGGGTYSWTPASGLSSTTISNPVASPTVTTQYIVTVTSAQTCTDKDTVVVTVNSLPNVDAGTNQSACVGGTAQLNASGAVSYTWLPATGLNAANIANPVATATAAVTYTVTGTDANGCKQTDVVAVSLYPQPTVNAGNNAAICPGNSTPLTATTSATTFSWSPAAGLSATTVANPLASPVATTNYTVTVTDANGCTATDAVTVTVNTLPNVNAGNDANVCAGASANLSASGGTTYSWSPLTGLSNPTIANPTATPVSPTNYTVTVTDANGCTGSDVVQVGINPTPVMAQPSSSNSDCGSSTGTVTAVAPTNGTAPYTYSINNGAQQSALQFNGLAMGTYTVEVTDANGCKSTQTINVGSTIAVNAAFTPSPASGTVPLSVTATNTSTGATNYIWTMGNGSGSFAVNPSTVYNNPGTYTITLLAYNNLPQCFDSVSYTVVVFPEASLVIPNVFTPNGDNVNDVFKISGTGVVKADVNIFDRWGLKVATWSGDLSQTWNGDQVTDGTFYYVIVAEAIDGSKKEYSGHVNIFR